MKKLFSKKLLPLLLAVVTLVAMSPISAMNVSAFPSHKTTGTETAPMTFEGTTKSWRIHDNPVSFSFYANKADQGGNANYFFSNQFHYAPDDAWITFDYDATALSTNTNASYPDQNTVVLYIYYRTGSVDNASEEMLATFEQAFANGDVRRTYTYKGQTYTDAKGGATSEPATWALSVPLGSKGTISFKIYDQKGNPVQTNELCCLNITQEQWFDTNIRNTKTCVISDFRTTIDILSPPIAYSASEVIRDDSGFLYTHQHVNGNTVRLYDGRYDASVVAAGNTDIEFWSSGNKGTANAPSGSRLAIYFDTTAIESNSEAYLDTNCFTSEDLYVFSLSQQNWIKMALLTGTTEDDYVNNITTVFLREENGVEKLRVTKNNKGYNHSPNNPTNYSIGASSWLFTLPSDARGYVIFTFKDPTKLRDIGAFKFGNDSYATASFNKTIYFGSAVVLPPTTVLAVDKGVGVTVSDTTMDITVDDVHKVQAGSLLVKDINGTALSVPVREGTGNSSTYTNVTDFTAATANQDVFIRYEEADTSTRPNFGYLGWQQNSKKGGLRSVYRFDFEWHEGNAWYNRFFTKLGGKTVEVDSFGIMLCTEKVYNRIGGAAGMVTTCTDASLYNTNFHDKPRRVDACAAYEDACFAMLSLNTDARKSVPIYSRAYMVIDGVTYYSDINFCSYDLSTKNKIAAETAITH